MAPLPSGKARVCKTLIPQFDSGWRLQHSESPVKPKVSRDFFHDSGRERDEIRKDVPLILAAAACAVGLLLLTSLLKHSAVCIGSYMTLRVRCPARGYEPIENLGWNLVKTEIFSSVSHTAQQYYMVCNNKFARTPAKACKNAENCAATLNSAVIYAHLSLPFMQNGFRDFAGRAGKEMRYGKKFTGISKKLCYTIDYKE
jgi:hypothetical protein